MILPRFAISTIAFVIAIGFVIKPSVAFRLQWRTRKTFEDKISRQLQLFAKKKTKLISDDFLLLLEEENAPLTESKISAIDDVKPNKKAKKLGKLGISENLLNAIDFAEEAEDQGSLTNSEGKKKKKKGKVDDSLRDEQTDVIVEEVASADVEIMEELSVIDLVAETLEQKLRKERPPGRVRFAESSQPDFVMMALEKVGLIYGNQMVLKDASFSVTTGERVGLVGPNGGGKTTQLRILAGEIEPTTGDVVKSSRDLRVSYLRQEFVDGLMLDSTLREELSTAFVEERALLNDIADLEEQVGRLVDDVEEMSKVLDHLQELQEKAISKGVYSLDGKVDKIMEAMGFTPKDGEALVRSFSGGWKMRIGLAKILLQDPNVLLLDEPTNHLDLDSVYWLEDFLRKQNIPMVIVSHDREFLDRVCNKIVDVEEGVTVSYDGNYSKFLQQRQVRLDLWREKYERQMRHVKEEEKWIKKAKNDPSMAQQVKAKEMALEKYKSSEDWVESPPRDRKFRFRFPPAPRCGVSVLEASKLSHGYGSGPDQMLFQDVEIQVDRGERMGFVGPNGAGKSTLMRLLMGVERPKSGYAEFGSNNVEATYFEQSQADTLDLEKTVLETVQMGAPSDISFTEIRGLLGQFMFKGDDVDKKLRYLSGGEKARVALCKMMLEPANLLMLDEPTNHLDITSKEVLEEALQHFEGAVLLISHDRYFMSQVANRIFSFEDKKVVRHDCDYHDFINGKGSDLKEKVEARFVEGDKYKITNAKEVIIEEAKNEKKKNFGGAGVTSGNLNKGIKNAKRYVG